jgi:uncharacterized protein (DUF1800 family)
MSTQAVIAANRFGLGARPGEIAAIGSDARGWLRAQLVPERGLPAPLAALPSTADDLAEFQKWLRDLAASAAAPPSSMSGMADDAGAAASGRAPGVESEFRRRFAPRYAAALKARFDVSTGTARPFYERLVHFWSNHFVVSGTKPAAVALPPSFERDAIRPHVTGRFVDMLLASSKHPAMLVYLDNVNSVGPSSHVGRNPELRRAFFAQAFVPPRGTGLNENLAREILELHTVGVRSGYTQADVTSFARVLTGWTVARPPRVRGAQLAARRLSASGLFDFDPDAHEPGTHVVLGRAYTGEDTAQGEAVLRDLARLPVTAEFIAHKLVRHFIADDPPREAVLRLAQVFTDTEGDLAEVGKALVDLPQAWAVAPRKFKTPEEYLVSALRALPALELDGGQLAAAVTALGQAPYRAPGPNGWPDVGREWLGPDAIWKRFQWANEAARRVAANVPDPERLALDVLGASLGEETRSAIRRADSAVQGLTLLLASAEFQRR